MPVPQRIDFLVERALGPVHKRLIDNGATSQVNPPMVQLLTLVVTVRTERFLKNGQSRKKRLNRSISDASWGKLMKED